MNEKFDVVIKEIKTGNVVSVIGKNLTESQADKREITGLMRINREDYFVDIIPVNK